MTEPGQTRTAFGSGGDADPLFRGLIESLPDSLIVVDGSGTMVIVNARAEVMFGYPRDELIGENVDLLVPERSRGAHPAHRDAYCREPRLRPMGDGKDLHGRCRDGTEFPVEISLSPIQTGQDVLIVSVVRDVSRRRATEIALRESEQMHRSLAEASPVGVFRTDAAGHFTYVNERWTEIVGLTFAAARDDGWSRAIHDADRGRVIAAWTQAMERGERYRCESRFVRLDGTVTWVYGQAVPLLDEVGRVEGYVGTIADTTELRVAQDALQERERRFRAIFDQEFQFVGLLATDGIVLEVNRTAVDAVGARIEDVIGRPFWETCFWSHSAAQQGRLRDAIRAAAGGEFVRFEAEHVADDGSPIHVDFSLKPIRDENRAIVYLLPEGRDISESREARERLRRLADELETRNLELHRSNQDLDDFAYIASHDLKEPVRGISNFASFLLEDFGSELGKEGGRMLETIRRLCERMESLIESLLAYSRVGNTELGIRKTDTAHVVEEAMESLQLLIRESHAEVRIQGVLPTLECDALRLGEVFYNLIANGIKYNDKPERSVEIGCGRTPEECEFYVRDNGIGIAPKHLKSVFGMFKRLHGRDEYGGGTGAGLTIARKIVERHGGRIWVESEPGMGTTFRFTLPSVPSR